MVRTVWGSRQKEHNYAAIKNTGAEARPPEARRSRAGSRFHHKRDGISAGLRAGFCLGASAEGRQAGSLSQKSGPQSLPGWLPILPVRLAQYPLLPLPEPSVSRREGTGNPGNHASSLPGKSHMSPGRCPSSGGSPSGSLDKAQDSCLAFTRSSPHSRLRPSS